MSRNKIYAIVEGQGEANRSVSGSQSAVTVLTNKLLRDLNCYTLFPVEKVPPFRMSYSEFFHSDKLERAIRYFKSYSDCAAVLVLLDMDDECPKEQASELTNRLRTMESLPFSVAVVCAKREYEAWFLASLETIHSGELYESEPEEIRNAKGWLRKKFGYKPTVHQANYTRLIDITIAHERSRSFRRLYHAFQEIIAATDNGETIITPLADLKEQT